MSYPNSSNRTSKSPNPSQQRSVASFFTPKKPISPTDIENSPQKNQQSSFPVAAPTVGSVNTLLFVKPKENEDLINITKPSFSNNKKGKFSLNEDEDDERRWMKEEENKIFSNTSYSEGGFEESDKSCSSKPEDNRNYGSYSGNKQKFSPPSSPTISPPISPSNRSKYTTPPPPSSSSSSTSYISPKKNISELLLSSATSTPSEEKEKRYDFILFFCLCI
jgi:hypothetical protein